MIVFIFSARAVDWENMGMFIMPAFLDGRPLPRVLTCVTAESTAEVDLIGACVSFSLVIRFAHRGDNPEEVWRVAIGGGVGCANDLFGTDFL